MSNQDGNFSMGRRGFLIASGGALAGLAVWRMAGPGGVVEAMPARAPGMVSIVEFSDAGVRGSVASLPKIVKTESEWRKLLSPDAFEITRRAGAAQRARKRGFSLHLLRHGSLQLGYQVRVRNRLAQLLGAHRQGKRGGEYGLGLRNGAHGGGLPPVRGPHGTRFQRRPAAHGIALLHEFRGHEIFQGLLAAPI
jgi:hypothetical protein